MSAQQVLDNLRSKGVAVNLNAGQIRLTGDFSEADVAAVRQYKPALISILTPPPKGAINRPMVVHARRLDTCPWDGCRGRIATHKSQDDLHVCLDCQWWFQLVPMEGRYE